MRRREFIGLLGVAAGALTCANVFAAQKSSIARIGLLQAGPPTPNRVLCGPRVQIASPRLVREPKMRRRTRPSIT